MTERIFSTKCGKTANEKPQTAVCRPILDLKVSNIRLKTKNVQTSAQVAHSRISAPAVGSLSKKRINLGFWETAHLPLP